MKRLLIPLAALLLLPFGFSQSFVVSPQAIVVNPKPSFGVEVWVDRDPSGNGSPAYQLGDEIGINVKVDQASYVYIFDVRPNGDIVQIFPNSFDSSNRLSAGETRSFPPRGARYVFNIAPPRGLSKVIAVASRTRLNTDDIARFQNQNDSFASSTIGESGFIQNFGIVIRPIPQEDWVTDTALYYVGNQPSEPAFGAIRLTSSPSGATAYVDDQFVGYTPLTYSVTPGTHNVTYSLDGYETYRTRVSVSGGGTETVNTTLDPVLRTGTASFRSTPSGADVYVDGRFVGVTPLSSLRFDAGSHAATFELAGYQSSEVAFDVRSGRDTAVSGNLVPARAQVVIRGNVGGAVVFIDAVRVGTLANGSGSLTVDDVAPGSHELVVMAPGYSTYVTNFDARAGRTLELSLRQSRY